MAEAIRPCFSVVHRAAALCTHDLGVELEFAFGTRFSSPVNDGNRNRVGWSRVCLRTGRMPAIGSIDYGDGARRMVAVHQVLADRRRNRRSAICASGTGPSRIEQRVISSSARNNSRSIRALASTRRMDWLSTRCARSHEPTHCCHLNDDSIRRQSRLCRATRERGRPDA